MRLSSRDLRALKLGAAAIAISAAGYSLFFAASLVKREYQSFTDLYQQYEWLVQNQTELTQAHSSGPTIEISDKSAAEQATSIARSLRLKPEFEGDVFYLANANPVRALQWVERFTSQGYELSQLQISRTENARTVELRARW